MITPYLNIKKYIFPFILLVYIVIFSCIAIFSYRNYLYSGADLAIFNQVFWNTIHGRFFEFSLTNTFYFGDHFAPLLIFLVPFYVLYQSPETLLVLQTIAIAIGGIPIFLFAKKILHEKAAYVFLLGYFLYPSTSIVNLLEFHTISFAIPLLGFTFYYFEQRKYRLFLLCAFLSLMIREEVSLVIFLFGAYALIQKRSLKWVLVPFISGAVWFACALFLISFFNQVDPGSYKYITYYQHLGDGPKGILENAVFRPVSFLQHVFSLKASWSNILFFITILFPYAFLSLYRVDILLLAAPTFFEHFFLESGAFPNLLSHRLAPLIPFILFSAIIGYKKFTRNQFFVKNKRFVQFALFFIFIVFSIGPGPLRYIPTTILAARNNIAVQFKDDLITHIPEDAIVLASRNFLPKVSQRQYLHHMYGVYMNANELEDEGTGYTMLHEPEYVLIDFNQFKVFDNTNEAKDKNRRQNLIRFFTETPLEPIDFADTFVLFKRVDSPSQSLVSKISENNLEKNIHVPLTDTIDLVDYRFGDIEYHDTYSILPLTIFTKINDSPSGVESVAFSISVDSEELHKNLPLGYDIYPSDTWNKGDVFEHRYRLLLPKHAAKEQISIIMRLVQNTTLYTIGYDNLTPHSISEELQTGNEVELNFHE